VIGDTLSVWPTSPTPPGEPVGEVLLAAASAPASWNFRCPLSSRARRHGSATPASKLGRLRVRPSCLFGHRRTGGRICNAAGSTRRHRVAIERTSASQRVESSGSCSRLPPASRRRQRSAGQPEMQGEPRSERTERATTRSPQPARPPPASWFQPYEPETEPGARQAGKPSAASMAASPSSEGP
jgi:hypothetical protein